MMGTHFTATVAVHQVTNIEASTYRNESKPARNDVVEVARIVLRASTLEKLQTKLSDHISLIEN